MLTITMDKETYDKMMAHIENQNKIIKELQQDSRVVVVDFRYGNRYSAYGQIPKITCDDNLAAQFLKKEFDELAKTMEYLEMKVRGPQMPVASKKHWWSFFKI